MYHYLKGNITFLDPTLLILETSGIGYEVKIPLSSYAALKDTKEETTIYCYLQVTENAHTLFGFHSEDEKKVFLLLISVSGVGPSTALMALSGMSASELKEALIQQDVNKIKSVKGIGPKTAQRVILELQDKAKELQLSSSGHHSEKSTTDGSSDFILPQQNDEPKEAINALITLGFTKAAAEKNVNFVLKKLGKDTSIEVLIKESLKMK